MNDIDERGRAAATALRTSMDDGFDIEAGLAAVLREESVVAVDDPAQRSRRGWMVLSAAAAVVAVGLVGTMLIRSTNDADVTDVPTVPATTAITTPSTVPTDSTSPDDTTGLPLEPTTTDTGSTTPGAVEQPVVVDDVVQVVTPVRSVYATAGFGSGAGQLAVEECQECDPARPWAPILIPYGPNGQVLVADAANRRWVMFERVSSTLLRTVETPWLEGVVVSAQPVVDDGGTVYAVVSGPLGAGGTTAGQLWVYDPADFAEPIGRYPASGIFNSPPSLQPGSVVLDGSPVEGLGASVQPRPSVIVDGSSTVTVEQDATTVEFVYPAETTPQAFGPLPGLPDGSALVLVRSGEVDVIDRLFLDGRVARMELPPVGSQFGAAFATIDGIIRLELAADGSSWELAQYALPTPVSLTSASEPDDRAAAAFATISPQPDLDRWIAAALTTIGAEYRDDCVEPAVPDPTATYKAHENGARVVLDLRISCDDSFGGYRWSIDVADQPDGVTATDITEQTICTRGVAVEGDQELCV